MPDWALCNTKATNGLLHNAVLATKTTVQKGLVLNDLPYIGHTDNVKVTEQPAGTNNP